MGRKKKPEPDDIEQSERFLTTAKELGKDIDNDAFKQILGKVLKAPKQKKGDALTPP